MGEQGISKHQYADEDGDSGEEIEDDTAEDGSDENEILYAVNF